ncbi:MAG: tyrosine-type recombinase/integrase, partial [Methylomonas sp.]|nr:tyrosine-type recombinase/integrase [Methylomonas sp.]
MFGPKKADAENKKKSHLPYLDDFLLFIQANNYSPETLYNYERDLKTFELFLTEELNGLPFLEAQKRTIEQYKAYLNSFDRKTAEGSGADKKLKSGSINRNLSSLRRYLAYLIDMDHEVPVAPGSIKLLRMEKRHPQVAELEDLIRLIESPIKFERDKLAGLRNRAVLETLLASGMRISELVSLRRNQLDKSGRIFVEGKGKKQRFVYLTDRAKEHIQAYLDKRDDDLPFMFVPTRGTNVGMKNKHISTNYLQMKIKKYRELLGINVPTSAHSLRHGFA